jgi:hypothetical protein
MGWLAAPPELQPERSAATATAITNLPVIPISFWT